MTYHTGQYWFSFTDCLSQNECNICRCIWFNAYFMYSGWKCHWGKNPSAFIQPKHVSSLDIKLLYVVSSMKQESVKPVFIRLSTAKNKYLLIPIKLPFLHLHLGKTDVMVSFKIPSCQVHSDSSQLPHQPYTAHYPWSSLQLATYSMWHLLPSSNEFFMSLPLPLTRRRGSYQSRSVNLCYCKWLRCLRNLWPFCPVIAIDCSSVGSILIRFVQRCCGAQCRSIIYNNCVVEV